MLRYASHATDAIDARSLSQSCNDLYALCDVQSVHDESILTRASIVKKKPIYFHDPIYNPPSIRTKMEDLSMTVCVAAQSGNMIFGASDRMLTGGDVEFEPESTKIHPVTNSIVAMTAGDSSFQSEVILELQNVLVKRIKAYPEQWWVVRDVAYLYLQLRNEVKRKLAEQAILAPLGLDSSSFLARQKELADGFIKQVTQELVRFEVPGVSTIFAGVDPGGAHIYTVEDDVVRCHDSVGFAAIGSGYWHADSQLMLAKHSCYSPVPDTLLLTYAAKRRAEVAPGVGNATDMFMIGPLLGSFTPIGQDVLIQLGETYTSVVSG